MKILYKYESGWHKFRTEDKSIGYDCAVNSFDEAVTKLFDRYGLNEVQIVEEGTGKEIRLPEVMRIVDIKKIDSQHPGWYDGYRYDALVKTSVDGGKTFWYCGAGKMCKTAKEARNYKEVIERREKDGHIRYRVSEDLQGGEFGMYRDYTVEQWRNQAIEWATMDDNDGLVESLCQLKQHEVIGFIAELWGLKFRKVRKDKKKLEGIEND